MIVARGLSKRYGGHAVLDDVTVSVARGERVALLGLNGAGKTTLIRCLLGLVAYDGALDIAGCDIRTDGRRARAMLGYVPQRAPHFEGTLEDVVHFFGRLRGLDPAAVLERLAALGLDVARHASKPVRTLSGGMLQKVLLALALAARVPLLLLDEPTANLDPRARREFLRALANVERDTTILLASHRFSDVEAVADRMLVLHHGRLVFDGRLADLRDRVEAASTMWLTVPVSSRERANAYLVSRYPGSIVSANGSGLGVRVPARARAAVLLELGREGVPVEGLRLESPSLHDVLEGALGLTPRSTGPED